MEDSSHGLTFKKQIIFFIISTIIGAVIGGISNEILNLKSDRREAEQSAMLLYYDLKMASDTIHSTNENISNISSSDIIYTHTTIANYINNYGELLINLRSDLDTHDLQNIIAYYKNLEVLEKIRVNLDEFTFEKDKEEQLSSEYENYKNFIKQMETQCNEHNENCIDPTIEKIKEIAKLEH
ncbi:hypothetical protein [Ferdinandcohnia sp. SAFN-114]|uniref:hypothetical protein n=1 Tax=Ferdinandcohnia sp. SAFN-114 TaxID=3387275 RepID=UPI003F8014A9